MSRSRKVVQALFGVAVVGALAFGATEARAAAGSECAYDPPSGQIGYCFSQNTCERRCQNTYGPGTMGICTFEGCCNCFI